MLILLQRKGEEEIYTSNTEELVFLSSGYSVEAAFRFYPWRHEDLKGSYISPEIGFRDYNLFQYIREGEESANLDVSYRMLDMRLKMGLQYESPFFSSILTEIYIGFAYRNVSYNTWNYTYVQALGKGKYTTQTLTETLPQFLMGIKFGLPF
jgi:hypothetical protein